LVTLTWKITVNCGHGLSYAAFSLPSGVKATWPLNGATYTDSGVNFNVENTTNNPFSPSIKFEAEGPGEIKNGASVTFRYTLNSSDYSATTPIQVQIHSGNDPLGYAVITPSACAVSNLGDYVWADQNANGIQDSGETGIPNVTVNLLDGTCTTQMDSTTTDADGLYHFTGLTAGTYCVQFVPPAGYDVSPQNQGSDDGIDSDADPTTGKTSNITLAAGQTDNTWDAGLYQPAALGDRVWRDTNSDGLQTAGEPGIGGVTVNLLDGTCTTQMATTTTASDGSYHFTDLVPGSYCVQFMLPGGYDFTSPNVVGSDELDSDADQGTGKTGTITLTPGETDNSWDAGLISGGVTAITLSSLSANGGGAQSPAGLAVIALSFVLAGSAVTFQRRRSR
jgi:hypothetical protein